MSAVGIVSVVLYFVSLAGITHQVLLVRSRARSRDIPELCAAEGISTFYVAMCFFSTVAYILFNLTLAEINHYLLWPRIFQVALFLLLLREVALDRRCIKTRALSLAALAVLSCVLFAIGMLFSVGREPVLLFRDVLGMALVGFATAVSLGILHQLREVWRRKSIGALSLRKEGACFVKDLSSLAAACCIHADVSWQLLFTHGVSALLVGSLLSLMLFYEQRRQLESFRFVAAMGALIGRPRD